MSSTAIDMYPVNPIPVVSIGTGSDVSNYTTSAVIIKADSKSESVLETNDTENTHEWDDNLSQQIARLWSSYRKNRKALGSALLEQKEHLANEKYGQWSAFLRHAGIPRASAERLIIGFQRYLALPPSVRKLEREGIDFCKPSVLQAIEDEANAYELAGLSPEEAAELVNRLKAAAKPKPNTAAVKPSDKTKPTGSAGRARAEQKLVPPTSVLAISPTTECTQPSLEQMKSYVRASLTAIADAALRYEIADDLSEWIDLEFLGEPGQATAA